MLSKLFRDCAPRRPSPHRFASRTLNRLVLCLLIVILALNGGWPSGLIQVEAQEAVSPVDQSSPPVDSTSASGPEAIVPVPGLQVPNGLAVDPITHRLYITSRDNDRLLMLDGFSHAVLGQVATGDSPWGVAVDPGTRRVYAASFFGGDLRIFNSDTLAPVATASIGANAELTSVATTTNMGRALVVSHRYNRLYVVNGTTGVVEADPSTGGSGAWGLAYNPVLNRAYISHRDSRTLTTLDGNNGWNQLYDQTVQLCPSVGQPGGLYGVAFNPLNQRLYIACGPAGNVNQVKVYSAAASGLSLLASVTVGSGGIDGGGGIAVNTRTGNVFFTNSTSNTVSVINSTNNQVVATLATGSTPFGAAVDPITGKVFIGNKTSNNLTVLNDTYPADPSLPAITLSKKTSCASDQITVTGRNFPASGGLGHAQVFFNGVYQTTVGTQTDGTFTATFTVPDNFGGMQTVTASELFWPWMQVGDLVRTPLPDLPIIFLPGLAGSTIKAKDTGFTFVAPPNPALCISLPPNPSCFFDAAYNYSAHQTLWLDGWGIASELAGNWRYLDAIGLADDGRNPALDVFRQPAQVEVGEPLWSIAGLKDVYGGLDHFLVDLGYVRGRTLFYFPFDWRMDYTDMDQKLEETIDLALQKSGKSKVILLAHSTGGVVARNYMLRRGTAKVDQLITMGTPFIGLPLAAKAMETGDDMGLGWHMGNFGIGLHPEEVKYLAQNYAGLYDLLPSSLWFTPSPADQGAAPPPYLIRNRLQNGFVIPEPLNFSQSTEWLRNRRNATLLNNGLTFQNQGIGNLSLLRDDVFQQRIGGAGKMTPSTIDYSPRMSCSELCLFGWCNNICVPLPELAFANRKPFGDDTVPLRSAIGGNLPAGDDRYYVVNNVPHMELPTNDGVQFLLYQMLEGELCGGGGMSDGMESVSMEASGSEITLIGTASLDIYDSQGHHAGPIADQLPVTENHIAGVDYSPGKDAVTATVMAGGPYTIVVRSTALNGSALLRVSTLDQGETDETVVYAGIPIIATTVATMTLAGPAAVPSPLQILVAPGEPIQTNNGTHLTGTAAQDLTPPATTVTRNVQTNVVTVTAQDGPDGTGVAQILVSGDYPPVNYTVYNGPFHLAASARCVSAVAIDNAGNASLAQPICRSWVPSLQHR